MIRFGTLGAARITPSALIAPCKEEARASVHVVGARSEERAMAFAAEHDIPHVMPDYQSVIDHPEVDAIYIPLPITAHKEWTLKSLAAGKPVLCEKSFSANEAEAKEMAEAARDAGLLLMDAFHYRYHPLFRRAKEIYDSGELGTIRSVDALFQVGIADTADIRMNYETGGGVTTDIGCYPISWLRHLIGAEPDSVTAAAEVGPPHVDVYLKSEMTFGDVLATAEGDMRPGTDFKAHITARGDKGTMHVINPLAPQHGHALDLDIGGEKRSETFDRRPTYSYQLDAFLSALETGKVPLTGAEDAVKQMALIDRCYEAAGLKLRGC